MQITIGAKCWDGERSKTLSGPVRGVVGLRGSTEVASSKLRKGMALIGYMIPVTFLLNGAKAFAAEPAAIPVMSDAFKSKILHAFDPLINLAISLSYPVAGVMIAGGCLFIMVGNRERGMQMLQNAAIGYILVQLSPMFLELLVGIGNGI